jgi:hypothetical protein
LGTHSGPASVNYGPALPAQILSLTRENVIVDRSGPPGPAGSNGPLKVMSTQPAGRLADMDAGWIRLDSTAAEPAATTRRPHLP